MIGIEDNFSTANDSEMSTPSAKLESWIYNRYSHHGTNVNRGFDNLQNDRFFGHTFTGLNQTSNGATLVGATLEFKAKAGSSSLAYNDAIGLLFVEDNNTGASWYHRLGDDPSNSSIKGLNSGAWVPGREDYFKLDLNSLTPNSTYSTNIISEMQSYGKLDLYIQDDTGVDYLCLNVHYRGNASGNSIRGFGGNDTLEGGGGNDYLYGQNGDDRLYGGDGNDWLISGDGNDYLTGQNGNDYLYGQNGNDYLYGGPGNDRLIGGDGNDRLYGQDGIDTLYGQNGNDYLYGQNGDDRLYGGPGNDRLYGGSGNDKLYGDNGNDYLRGDQGNDHLVGGDGNDTLTGAYPYYNSGRGEIDTLEGGSGTDLFVVGDANNVYYKGNGKGDYALIRGFNANEGDKLQLKGPKSSYYLISGSSTSVNGQWLGAGIFQNGDVVAIFEGTGISRASQIFHNNTTFVGNTGLTDNITSVSNTGLADNITSVSNTIVSNNVFSDTIVANNATLV